MLAVRGGLGVLKPWPIRPVYWWEKRPRKGFSQVLWLDGINQSMSKK